MSDIDYSITPVDEKPKTASRHGRKGGMYDPIIDAFLDSKHSHVRVDGTGKKAYNLSTQLKAILKKRGINTVQVSVRNNAVYLVKI